MRPRTQPARVPPLASALTAAVFVLQAVVAPAANAQLPDSQSGRTVIDSPRWSYDFHAGEFRPDLDLFETFYGDTKETYYGLGGSYRFLDWLELGGGYGRMKATGVGILTTSEALGGAVSYELNVMQVYTNFILQRRPRQRVVPYVGVGIAAAKYEQEVSEQPDVDGWTDAGASARAGLRFFLTSHGPVSRQTTGSPYWRSFLFLEAQDMTVEVDGIDLGGTTYVLGFRMEFDVTR